MALTPAQLTTFKTDILANTDPAVVQAVTDGDSNTIAAWYNGQASPDWWVYRGIIGPDEVGAVIELDDVGNMTTGDVEKLSAFFRLRPGGFNASLASDRAGFDDVLSAAAANDSQQAVIALWKRLATEIEKLFSVGSGAGTNADPDTLGFSGSVSFQDVTQALNS